MYNLLIVDDEPIVVKGIAQAIDWTGTPIRQVFEAYDAEDAKLLFREHPIHVMISDIEMPGENGIELLQWVNESYPATQTIFLSGHADFHYAQQALQSGSFDYLLKPIVHEDLKAAVLQALGKIGREEEQARTNELYQLYSRHWTSQLPLLVERFWQDLINERIPANEERLRSAMQMYELPVGPRSSIMPVLISVEQWMEEYNARDEEIMEYALRNVAAEVILSARQGVIVQDQNGINAALVYVGDDEVDTEALREEVSAACEAYIVHCSGYLRCQLSCYIGDAVPVTGIASAYRKLLQMEEGNITRTGSVIAAWQGEWKRSRRLPAVSFPEWSELFELGSREKLKAKIHAALDGIREDQYSPESLLFFYYGILHMVLNVLTVKGYSIQEVYRDHRLSDDAQAVRTLDSLRQWAVRTVEIGIDYMLAHTTSGSEVVRKLQKYIQEHLDSDLSRDDLAAHVHLNAAYLSRIFKKEMGCSISDYIIRERMNKAKLLLEHTNQKVSAVAESVGYLHFAHFTKMFKKATGCSPQDYRRQLRGGRED